MKGLRGRVWCEGVEGLGFGVKGLRGRFGVKGVEG